MKTVWKKFSKSLRSICRSKIWFLAPSLIGVCIFVLIPFADVIRRSFQTAVTGNFCGLRNYKIIITNQAFLLAVVNTLRFVGTGLPLLVIFSLLLALALNRCSYVQQLKSSFLFPLAVPTATVVFIWKLFFYKNGIINACIGVFGGSSVDWLGSDAAFWVLIISYLWKNTGYTVVLWLAGLKNISTSLIEAAKMDGASEQKCFWYVILPELKPVLYTITILSFLNSFKVFREVYLVAGAYPQQKMYLLQHLFNNWFTSLNVDKMAAAAVCIAIIFTIFVLFLRRIWEEKEDGY